MKYSKKEKDMIEESILFRKMVEAHLKVAGVNDAISWLAAHVGLLSKKVELLEKKK